MREGQHLVQDRNIWKRNDEALTQQRDTTIAQW